MNAPGVVQESRSAQAQAPYGESMSCARSSEGICSLNVLTCRGEPLRVAGGAAGSLGSKRPPPDDLSESRRRIHRGRPRIRRIR
jgi:hypothetical protein